MQNDDQYFKKLSLMGKIKYYFSDNWKITIGIIFAVVIGVFLLKEVIGNKNYNSYCLVFNDSLNNDLFEQISNGFPKYLNDENYLINISNYDFIYLEEYGIMWPEEDKIDHVLMGIVPGLADIIISDYETIHWAIYKEYIQPIDLILPAELLEKLKPYFVHLNGILYGLNISETEVYKRHSGNYKNAVILIPYVANQPDMYINFIRYIFGME